MAHWEEALERQVALLAFWRSPNGEKYARRFARDVGDKDRPWEVPVLAASHAVEAAKLERGAPVYVDRDVHALIDHARHDARPEIIRHEDLFTPEGFALLPQALMGEDIHEKAVAVRAFSWGPVLAVEDKAARDAMMRGEEMPQGAAVPMLHVVLYSHIDDEDDYSPELKQDMIEEAARLGVDFRQVMRQTWRGPLSMFHAGMIPFSREPGNLRYQLRQPDGLTVEDRSRETLWQLIQTFFRLAQQEIIRPSHPQGDRHARRRVQRLRPDLENVLVVHLRRQRCARPDAGESEVEWSRQWVVSGHWRNQWFPTLGAHRQIWIAPHVKGPEDKPLVLHAGRAFEFDR